MEDPPSKLDHLHLPRPDHSAAGTPTFATWTRQEKPEPEDKDTVMAYDEDEAFGEEKLQAHTGPSAFNTAPALDRYAPLPSPAITGVKRIKTTMTVKDKPHRPVGWTNGRRSKGIDPPAMAVPLRSHKFADFRPWRNDGPEDILNENVIRTGFADKSANAVPSETNVTRPSFAPVLRNKGGLPLLSMLLVQVMDKRQALGRCTAPSTFKPPPRVTLTDTKREAWLRDLAATDVPLRRLSRTIPHGIRGKVLLDQCFSKNVPLPRAIWLIKCVGANEIRAFRRKGISGAAAQAGEIKWIREWTVCVEQFVAGIAANCGQETWRMQTRAAVRLSAALFTEDLLDHQHFLDWLIESFAASSVDMLPFWMLLTGLFWRHIVRVQRRGQGFTDAIVAQLGALDAYIGHPALDELRSSLHQYLLRLVHQHHSCTIGVKSWQHARRVFIKARDQTGDARLRGAFDDVILRNDRLNPAQTDLVSASKTARLLLFEYLDTLSIEAPVPKAIEKCLEIIGDHNQLTTALLDWASSIHRAGLTRGYHTIRLLTHLAEQGHSLDAGILHALSDVDMRSSRDQMLFAKVIAELTAARLFNYGKYLQWLISTGAASRHDQHCMELLFSVPLNCISSQAVSLRNAILGRLGISGAMPSDMVALQSQLGDLVSAQTLPDNAAVDELATRILALQPCYRHVALQNLVQRVEAMVDDCLAEKQSVEISPEQFSVMRNIFEATSELRLLSKLLNHLLRSATPYLFAELAAAVENHARVFVAMGTLNTLLPHLSQSYAFARQSNDLNQVSIRSMIAICRAQTKTLGYVAKLENDLATFEQQHAASVCSPASDSILTVQNGHINSDEDIDIMLASGNTMEEQMLARLFSAIVERTVKWTMTGSVLLHNPSRWFRLLRAFDNVTFDRHMNLLVSKLVLTPGTDQVRAILIALVASGCLRLDSTLSALEKRLDQLEATSAPQLARFALGVLQTLLPSGDLDHQSRYLEIYRFRIAQRQVCEGNRQAVLRFVWHALSAPAEVSSLLFSKSAVAWLADCLVKDPATFQLRLNVHDNTPGQRSVQLNNLVRAMCAGVSTQGAEDAAVMDLDGMICSVGELRLPFLQLLLRRLALPAGEGQPRPDILASLRKAIQDGNKLWPQLIDCVGAEVVAALRQDSCASVVRMAEAFLNGAAQWSDDVAAQGDINVAAMTAHRVPADDMGVTGSVADLLHSLAKQLEDDTGTGPVDSGVESCIGALVKLLISTTPVITTEKIMQAPLLTTLNTVSSLAANPQLQTSSIAPLLLDYLTLLLRNIPIDTLHSLHRRLPSPVAGDPRIQNLYAIEPAQKPFSLASRVPTPSHAPTTATTTATSPNIPQTPGGRPRGLLPAGRNAQMQETKYAPFAVRSWELMRDPTPNAGENDASLSLGLFAARRVY